VIGIAGPYDFLPLTDDDLKALFGPPEHYAQTQPVTFVDGDEPPFLLLHGTRDRTVRPRNSASLARALEARGERVTLKSYPGVGHTRILVSLADKHAGLAPTLEDLCGFVGCL
jgi:dipeptidyl aminopeptidase/acylaminoacyl peptidase